MLIEVNEDTIVDVLVNDDVYAVEIPFHKVAEELSNLDHPVEELDVHITVAVPFKLTRQTIHKYKVSLGKK